MSLLRVMFVSLVIAIVCGCTQTNEYQPPPPPNVIVAKPVVQTVTNYLEETGTSVAAERVEIRARVDGFLERIDFEEGGNVQAGDRLYLIQPSEYENAVAQAEAQVELARVEIARSKNELLRQRELFQKNATSKANLEEADAAYNSAVAAEKVVQANLDQAKLNLEYCEIKTPIDGRVERTLVKLGNLVSGKESTHLTTVVSYDPIHVYFNISEQALLLTEKRTRNGEEKRDLTEIKAFLRRSLDDAFPFEGNLDYADLGVDQSTGTFTIRALFPNPNGEILPGLFVRIRVPIGTIENAVLLPERSIGFDQVGRYVMIVGDGNLVERRNVEVGSKFGELVVIVDGLTGSETVVIDGLQRARPGTEVIPKQTELQPIGERSESTEDGSASAPLSDTTGPSNEPSPNAKTTHPERIDAEATPGDDAFETE